VKPFAELRVAQRLQSAFLHLEPLELEIVAGGIPSEHEVRILDLSLLDSPRGALSRELESYRPDVVGFTAYSSTYHVAKQLIRATRERCPDTVVMVGGVHATLRPCDYADMGIDAIVRGEGGSLMEELMRRIVGGDSLAIKDRVLCPSDPDFDQAAKRPFPRYPEPDAVPLPNRGLVDRTKYFSVWTASGSKRSKTVLPRIASVRTSVGCPFRCSFCVVHQVMHGIYAQRDPGAVVDEIASLKESHVYFVDDEMFINAERTRRIAELLRQRGIKKRYTSWARSDTILRHPEVFQLWKEVGLDVVYVGLESMCGDQLNAYNKKTDSDVNRKAVALLRELGIVLHASLIIHPDYSVDDFRTVERIIKELAPAEITFTVLSPSPGTDLWQACRDRFICDPFRYYDCMHTLLPTRLPLRRFYQHFGRISALGLRHNPLRLNRVRVPLRELFRLIREGFAYVFSLYRIYKDYPPAMWLKAGDEQLLHRSEGEDEEESSPSKVSVHSGARKVHL